MRFSKLSLERQLSYLFPSDSGTAKIHECDSRAQLLAIGVLPSRPPDRNHSHAEPPSQHLWHPYAIQNDLEVLVVHPATMPADRYNYEPFNQITVHGIQPNPAIWPSPESDD
jgi:hypothetical protein